MRTRNSDREAQRAEIARLTEQFEAEQGPIIVTPIQARRNIPAMQEIHRKTWICREDSYQPLLGIIRSMKEDGLDDQAIAVAARTSPERVAYVRSVWGISA